MRRTIALTATTAVLLAACGDDGGGSQPQTEQGAIDATLRAMRGTLEGDADAILAFATEECRDSIDREELELGLILLRSFMEEDDFDIGDVELSGEIEAFDGDTATVQLTYDVPEGADDGFGSLMLTDDEIDVIYENGRWVGEDCDFGESSGGGDGADLEADLADLGLTGTQDDPIPAGTAAPVGGGFQMVIDAWDPDAVARYDEANDTTLVLDDGEQFGVLEYTLVYTDDEEPKSLGDLQIELVGADAVAVDQRGCDAIGNDTYFTSRAIFTGGEFDGVACFAGTSAQFADVTASVSGSFFQDRNVYFDPETMADSPTTVSGTTGPSPDGDATDDRTAPTPVGTPIELDGDWTVQVDGFQPDATDAILAESTFADDPRPNGQYALLDVTLTYTGEDSGSAFAVAIGMVGDSNVAADDCSFVSVPGELDTSSELFTGGTVSGSICFEVDADDTASLVAYFRSNMGFDGDLAWSAIS